MFLPRSASSRNGRHSLFRAGVLAAVLLFAAISSAPLLQPRASAAVFPTISAILPAQGSVTGGEQVQITGSGFKGALGVCNGNFDIWFGADADYGYALTPPSYQVVSDTQINAVVPANFGGTVDVRVHNKCGTSPVQSGDQFTYAYPANQCVAGSCSIDVQSTAGAPIGHVANGLLDGFNTDAGVAITSQDATLTQALSPRQWRLGQAGLNEPNGGLFGLARSVGAQISLDLGADWQAWASKYDKAYWQAPYGDLSTYSAFLVDDVRQRIAANEMPDYFDVWNEPSPTGSINQWLSVYRTAWDAIQSVAPGAKVVGPSIAEFLATSPNNGSDPGYDLDLADFLHWETSTGVRFAAITWHENGGTVTAAPNSSPGLGLPPEPVPGGLRDSWSPQALASHVATARAIIAGYSALQGTQVFVNEYGPTYAANIPGWMVGNFVALETSSADQAMLTCVVPDACSTELDGLIGADGSPQMPYWVMKSYAGMAGALVGTSSPSANLYALATRVDSSQTMQALVGRADDCWSPAQCPQFQAPTGSPVNVSVNVSIPWSLTSVNVTIRPFRNSATHPAGYNDVPSEPAATVMSGLAVTGGKVSIPLQAINDGDAFSITICPA